MAPRNLTLGLPTNPPILFDSDVNQRTLEGTGVLSIAGRKSRASAAAAKKGAAAAAEGSSESASLVDAVADTVLFLSLPKTSVKPTTAVPSVTTKFTVWIEAEQLGTPAQRSFTEYRFTANNDGTAWRLGKLITDDHTISGSDVADVTATFTLNSTTGALEFKVTAGEQDVKVRCAVKAEKLPRGGAGLPE